MTHEELRGIDGREADRFDDQWRQHAETSLLGGTGRLGSRSGSGSRAAAEPQRYLLEGGSGHGSGSGARTASRADAGYVHAQPPAPQGEAQWMSGWRVEGGGESGAWGNRKLPPVFCNKSGYPLTPSR